MSQKLHVFAQEAASPLHMLGGRWDLRQGYHPHLAANLNGLAEIPLFPSPEQLQGMEGLALPVMPSHYGHHVVRDAGYLAAATPEGGLREGVDEYPLAPLFVRDLTGRVIHTGLMPLPAAPSVPVFPAGCQDVPATAPGAALIENAIFTTYRRMECAPPQGAVLAGQPELALQALYAQPSTYPYKLRPDTFYADGWRLPQVARVFVRAMPPVQAQKAAEEFEKRWQQRSPEQTYEAFYDANDGESWFEELFLRGCTVIPTIEAYNGRFHVDEEYVATGVDGGRAVKGLHQVEKSIPSDQPKGTILEVLHPGWITAAGIQPAKVVVSDGSGFKAPEAPVPALPDLHQPHSRTSAEWGAVWLPQHPQHFAEPALWDWDAEGHFIQVSGPLWDPLHYVYTSTPALVRAHRHPLPGVQGIYRLPEKLKARFHPVAAPNWYHAINERTAQQRSEDAAHPLYGSGLDEVPLSQPVCSIGYHPLPWGLEYELDTAHFPGRHPQHRVQECPQPLQGRIAGRITLTQKPSQLASYHVAVTEPMRAILAEAEESPKRDDFAILQALQSGSEAGVGDKTVPSWLPDMPSSQLLINIKRLFADRAYRHALNQAGTVLGVANLPSALYQFREAALAWRRLRYRLFTKYPLAWQTACLQGLDLSTAENQFMGLDASSHQQVRNARAKLLGVRLMPARAAVGLPSGNAAARVNGSNVRSRGRGTANAKR